MPIKCISCGQWHRIELSESVSDPTCYLPLHWHCKLMIAITGRVTTAIIDYYGVLTLERPGGGIRPPWQKILFFNMKTGFKDPETPWLSQFYTNESNGTKFSTCFYIGMGLRDFFVRTSLGENGYFFGFWDYRPHFKLILHTSKWILCPQMVWKLFIYILVNIQHNL